MRKGIYGKLRDLLLDFEAMETNPGIVLRCACYGQRLLRLTDGNWFDRLLFSIVQWRTENAD